MASLYVIGSGQSDHAPFAIGLAKDPKELLAELQAARPDDKLRLMRAYDLERGWDNLAVTILRRRIGQFGNGDGWYRVSSAAALSAVEHAYSATHPAKPTKKRPVPEPRFGEVMRAIRTQVFGATMEVIATIAGTSASSVSRWESGELDPGLAEIRRLRAYAYKHGLAWRDAMLFDGAKEEAVL